MKVKTITQEELHHSLDYDPETGVFTWKNPPARGFVRKGDIAGAMIGGGYLRITVRGHYYLSHRLAWLYVYGVLPDSDLDHINRNRQDNRISNLRLATRMQNAGNRGMLRNNRSGYKGVCFDNERGKWLSQIRINGQRIRIGRFATAEEAAAAYQKVAREVQGEFAGVYEAQS